MRPTPALRRPPWLWERNVCSGRRLPSPVVGLCPGAAAPGCACLVSRTHGVIPPSPPCNTGPGAKKLTLSPRTREVRVFS